MARRPTIIIFSVFLGIFTACSGGADGLVRLGSSPSSSTIDTGASLPNGPLGFADALNSAGDQGLGKDSTGRHIYLDLGPNSQEAPTNHPCQTALTPGSIDQACSLAVCTKDAFCCDSYWDSVCVQYAKDHCNISCDCQEMEAEFLTCDTNEDCSFCGGNLCSGNWGCEQGTCVPREDVVCDSSENNGCIQNTCNPKTGICAVEANNKACIDEDPCTKDQCLPTNGYCQHASIPLCMKNSPCKEAESPFSNSPEISECVCAIHPDCCSDKWSWWCTYVAESECQAECDCKALPKSELSCLSDADCTFCDPESNACTGRWTCQSNHCVKEDPIICDTTNDVGCFVNTCVPELENCTMKAHDKLCDDNLSCTTDFCTINVAPNGKANVECVYQAEENCTESDTGSCVNRCGAYESGAGCQCDVNCGTFDDCCKDKCTVCTQQPECN